MKRLSICSRLLVIGSLAALAGCPSQTGVNSGPTTLTLNALAITAKDPKVPDTWLPKVYLSWNEVPATSKYELNLTGSTVPLQSTSATSFTHTPNDGVKEGRSYTYTVRALDANNQQKIASSAVTTEVLAHSIGAVPSVSVTPATGDKVTSTTPTISWSEVTGATGYWVKVVRIGDTETTVYAALVQGTSVKLGEWPLETVKWLQFDQSGKDATLTGGKNYKVNVQALATKKTNLAEAREVDVADESTKLFSVGN
ncbi:MAG: hypothetical protein FJZ00_04535 [Candidatus Sericytochromatia bacterium]|uniref:Fibronectin type-III domain-containing protein n=1 Tax=Candidatus Tanganyikabacteria bacterium TaxID=2961651 RepID=A0A937X571_9BACT|nr:hypothetical protein [Candidatus Tanganyikabacteria bacterium]